ncbi:MAG: ABC transporter ATP-binding protein [Candidatus Nezhaarchaeota archaeon]|nr:ABC transporter ATP-binding protein [Candidatus Nezhaarchaeota archaeon]
MKAIEVSNLVKFLGGSEVLKGISFKVDKGEVFGLIGPNGAGKTTTLRILATILAPSDGEVRIFGLDATREVEEVRKFISYLPEEAGVYPRLSGLEYLHFMAGLYADKEERAREMVEEGVRIADLGDKIRARTATYSKGMKRRLLIARALMVRPRLAILDEPTSGLDVVHALHIRRRIKEYAKMHGLTVVLSSHNMLEVEFLCDRVAFIYGGRVIAEGSPKEFKERYGSENLEEAFAKVAGLG